MIPTNPRRVIASPWKLYIEGVILSIPVKITIGGNFATVGVDSFGDLFVRGYVNLLMNSKIEARRLHYLIIERVGTVEVGDDGSFSHWDSINSTVSAMSFIATLRSER